MICGDRGRFANTANILSQQRRFLLDREEAPHIIIEMKQQVENTWYDTVGECGASLKDAETIRPAFADPGLSHNWNSGGI